MTTTEVNIQSLSITEKIHYTNLWCKELGIKSADLGCQYRIGEDGKVYKEVQAHPQIDDVILLIKFLQEYLDDLIPTKRVYLHIIWNWVYTQKKPLTKRHLKNLHKLTIKMNNLRYNKGKRWEKQRQRIKAFKNPTIAR
jgi:hypothetical protein